jgi:ankyrin repeat protein
MPFRPALRPLLLTVALLGTTANAAWALDDYLSVIKQVQAVDIPGLRADVLRGDDLNHQDDQGRTALTVAAIAGNPEMIKLLMQGGARATVRDNDGRVALHWAVQKDNPDAVAALLDSGASIEALDPHGTTPLMMAADQGNLAVIRILLAHHAKVDVRDYTGRSAYDIALGARQTRAAELLKQAGGA